MFTQCPDCRKTYPVTKRQLRAKKPQIFCTDCKKKFNAKTLLNENTTALVTEAKAEYIPKPDFKQKTSPNKKSETKPHSIIEPPGKLNLLVARQGSPEPSQNQHDQDQPVVVRPEPFVHAQESPVERLMQKALNIGSSLSKIGSSAVNSAVSEPAPERLPWEAEKKPFNFNWFVGFIVGSVLLLGQLIYFEVGKLSQNASYRPPIEKLCRWLGCQLPDYQNLDEFEVLQGSFTPNADNTITFKAIISNQAAFKQRLPNIKLTLLDYNEQIFAQRIFGPKDYISGAGEHLSIAPDATVSINLTIAAPKSPIGGYNFDLIYIYVNRYGA